MVDGPASVVVVGGGFAAAHAVSTLRDEGFGGAITVVGAEPHLPYERPPLSKGYLLGKDTRNSVFVHGQAWYSDLDVDVMVDSRAESLDAGERAVTLADGSRIAGDALLLATGSRARLLDLPGMGATNIATLRNLEDSERLRAAFEQIDRLAVIGAGWIGLEVTAAARLAGVAVTVLEKASAPLVGVLGPEVAAVFAGLHEEHGVDLRMGVDVEGIERDGDRATGVRLAGGEVVPADLVLVGVGAVPNLELARDAGLHVERGVVVDEALRTSAEGIWAAGDLAQAWHPVLREHVRVEHWDNAKQQGAAAARSILGQPVSYDRLPYFFTDQYDLGMEYTGYLTPGGYDEVVLRGDVPGREFVALWRSQGRVLAGMGVNVWDAMDPIRALVTSRRVVDAERLRDTATPLGEV